MTFFFALGASGGMLSLLMQGKPIFQSAHVWTGLGGLACLGLNGMLSLFFEDDPNARTAVSAPPPNTATRVWVCLGFVAGYEITTSFVPPSRQFRATFVAYSDLFSEKCGLSWVY